MIKIPFSLQTLRSEIEKDKLIKDFFYKDTVIIKNLKTIFPEAKSLFLIKVQVKSCLQDYKGRFLSFFFNYYYLFIYFF